MTLAPRLLAAALLAAVPAAAAADASLVLLGTAGGPTPKKLRAAPAQAIVVGGEVYVVDCGNGVGRQMALAGLPFQRLRAVFLTHHHSDHAADLVTLPLLAWAAGLERPIDVVGPPPLAASVKAGMRAAAVDAATREKDEGRRPFREIVRAREIRKEGEIYRDDRVVVTAARVDHPPIRDAFAYRFDTAGWSVVVSGDTAPSEALVRLARGADVLVHEVLLYDEAQVAAWIGEPADHPLVRHIVRSHTSLKDVGRIARDAGVGTLVLSHFVPGDLEPDEAGVLAAIRATFAGRVIFGRDLLEIGPEPTGNAGPDLPGRGAGL